MNVAVVGATGQVGGVMLQLLAERNFPVGDIRFLASARSAGKTLAWQGQEVEVEDLTTADFTGIEVAVMSAGKAASRQFAPKIASSGAVVVDNSSAWRMDPEGPLVVADVNNHPLGSIPKGIVANPNCTTMVAMLALKPLHLLAGLERLVISTYQAISGAGLPGVAEFSQQLEVAESAAKAAGRDLASTSGTGAAKAAEAAPAYADTSSALTKLVFDGSAVQFPPAEVFASTIAFNVLPVCGSVVADGSLETDEEQKLRNESRKILEIPALEVWATCVRVPVFTGHSMTVNATFSRSVSPNEAEEALRAAPGVEVCDMPTPQAATGTDVTLVGRIRQTAENSLSLFLSGDNLRKGAALNAIQIAELLG